MYRNNKNPFDNAIQEREIPNEAGAPQPPFRKLQNPEYYTNEYYTATQNTQNKAFGSSLQNGMKATGGLDKTKTSAMTIDKTVPSTDLNAVILRHLASEVLDKRLTFPCTLCGQSAGALTNSEIWLLPPIFIIKLNRFTENGHWRKSFVDFPLRDLDMSSFCALQTDAPLTYDLQSVIYFKGETMSTGTTFTITKNQKTGQFWKFEREKASIVIDPSNIVTEFAYILIYGRNNQPKILRITDKMPYGVSMNVSAGTNIQNDDDKETLLEKKLEKLKEINGLNVPSALQTMMIENTTDESKKMLLTKEIHELEPDEVENYLKTHNELKKMETMLMSKVSDLDGVARGLNYLDKYRESIRGKMAQETQKTQAKQAENAQNGHLTSVFSKVPLKPAKAAPNPKLEKKAVLIDLKRKEERLTTDDLISDDIVMDVVQNRLRNKTDAKYVPLSSDIKGNKFYGKEAEKQKRLLEKMRAEDEEKNEKNGGYHAYEARKKNEEMNLKFNGPI